MAPTSQLASGTPSRAGTGKSSRFFRLVLAALCLLGLVRGFLILQEYLVKNPLALTPISDAKAYWQWADTIARGAIVGHTPFLQAPLYPYLLGVIRAVGGGLLTVYWAQLVLHVATAACLGLIGRARFGPTVGLVSAGLFLLLDEPVFSSTRLLATTVQLVLICLLWLQLLRIERSRSMGAWALGGLVLGLNCLANAPMILLVVALGGWALFQSDRWSRRVRHAAAFVAAAVLVISVATLHNWLASGEFIPITANAGVNFRLGNASGSTGGYTPIPGIDESRERMFADAARVYQRETGQPLSWRKVDAYFLRQGLSEWKSNPLWAVKLAMLKFHYFISGRNYSDIYQLRAELGKGLANRLRLAPLPVAWLIGPAAVGVLLMLRRPGSYWPELVLLLVPLLVVVTFWYSPRYRMPAVPVLAVAGAWALVLATQWREHRRCSAGVVLALTLAIGLGQMNRAVGFDPSHPGSAQLALQLGQAYYQQGRADEAIQAYHEVLESNPLHAQGHNGLGNALAAQGQLDEAISHYRQALQVKPDDPDAHYNLGITLRSQGKLDEAISHYRQALRAKPDFVDAYSNLGIALESLGKLDEAVTHFRHVLRLEPDDADTHNNLGIALDSQGKLGEAISHYRQALHLKPGHIKAHYNLGNALTAQGKLDEAISHYCQALQLKPDFADAHINLGLALSAQGQWNEAISHYRQALQVKPDDAPTHYKLGMASTRTGRPDWALEHLREAVRLRPDSPVPLNEMAWILTTYPDPKVRDASQAIRLAERASELTQYQDADILDTLAAAYAAAGQFERAVTTAKTALELASAARADERANHIRMRLELYRQAKPYLEPVRAK